LTRNIPSKRLWIYLLVVFAIMWPAWWLEAALSPPGSKVFANTLTGVLYCIAGLGPTVAPFVAVALTKRDGTLGEYMSRLFRWRVSPFYCLLALFLPVAAAGITEYVLILASGLQAAPIEPLSRLLSLFPLMILGGGLEELGWRGVLQPELERRFTRFQAAAIVGVIWATWHLPLFFIPGVAQYGGNFGVFAVGIFGNAMMLALIYGRTRSILLCILFHASNNVTDPMGLHPLNDSTLPVSVQLLGAAASLVFGAALLLISERRPSLTA
jgi:uncharacterized protein